MPKSTRARRWARRLHYLSSVGELEGGGEVSWPSGEASRPSSEDIALDAVRTVGPSRRAQALHQTDDPIIVEIDYEVLRPISGMRLVLAVLTQEGEVAFRTTDHKYRPETDVPGRYRSRATLPGRFLNRRNYVIVVSFEVPGVRMVLGPLDVMTFTVSGPGHHGSDFPEPWDGAVSPAIDWTLEPLKDDGTGGPSEAAFDLSTAPARDGGG